MKKYMNAVLLAALLTNVLSTGTAAEKDPIFTQFESALGFTDTASIDAVSKRLSSEWIGKSKQDVQSYIRRVIQNRGKLSAMKTGGRESRPDLLVLSHRSEVAQEATLTLKVRFHYDDELKVSRVECTSS